MPLVPCLYLLWFSYNQMENLEKQIRPACYSLCFTNVPLLGPFSYYLPCAPLQGGLPPSPFVRQFQCQFQEEPSAKSIHICQATYKSGLLQFDPNLWWHTVLVVRSLLGPSIFEHELCEKKTWNNSGAINSKKSWWKCDSVFVWSSLPLVRDCK